MNRALNTSDLTLRALEQAEQAINDAIALYAPEFSHASTVKAAQARMAEKGTLGYYADVLETIRAARKEIEAERW